MSEEVLLLFLIIESSPHFKGFVYGGFNTIDFLRIIQVIIIIDYGLMSFRGRGS